MLTVKLNIEYRIENKMFCVPNDGSANHEMGVPHPYYCEQHRSLLSSVRKSSSVPSSADSYRYDTYDSLIYANLCKRKNNTDTVLLLSWFE